MGICGEGGPNIATPAVGSEGKSIVTPTEPLGVSEEDSMDSNPSLEERVRNVDQHYHQLLRETTWYFSYKGRSLHEWVPSVLDTI